MAKTSITDYLVLIQLPKQLLGADTVQGSDESDEEATPDPNHLPRIVLAARREISRKGIASDVRGNIDPLSHVIDPSPAEASSLSN